MNERNHRKIGTAYEKKAVLFLQEKGYRILERNYQARHGEIDIIAKDGEYLVFVEVKYRKNAYEGAALAAVTRQKQERIRYTAQQYLFAKNQVDSPCRFDVIAYEGEKLTYIRNAF